ncbi:MAG: Ppx/GppA phosphatase family protein [Arenicellales bacterium]
MSSLLSELSTSQTLAAIDLGSNSFHMVIAEQDENGRLQLIDRVKEMVRLNAGLDQDGNLSEESQQRAMECLDRFSQRLRAIPPQQVRAVGTNTFRAARNADEFIARAEHALGHHISIISGREEARLVYLGAAFSLESSGKQRLVIDIGGGSTELIIGRGYKAITMNSLYMGCVSFSRRFFPQGKITLKRLQKARLAAFYELEPVTQHYLRMGWQEVVGTSGTIRAVDDLSRALGLNQDWLSNKSFPLIDEYLIKRRSANKLDHISEQRMPVFAGGYAIISAIFKALGLERLDCASGALREGVLYDLNGRLQNHDSRDQGVDAIVSRFGLDMEQSERIELTCLELLDQVEEPLQLDQVVHHKLLGWASRLHEIGISIAFNQHHKHGSYIVENSDIDGFSRQQQRLLALLIRSHRQKFPSGLFQGLSEPTRSWLQHLAVLLRLSVALNRSRSGTPKDQVTLKVNKNNLQLSIDRMWCEDHPLTVMDLELERNYLKQAGIEVKIKQR